jgi:hypothetical protein
MMLDRKPQGIGEGHLDEVAGDRIAGVGHHARWKRKMSPGP